jgi:hypothetical protein
MSLYDEREDHHPVTGPPSVASASAWEQHQQQRRFIKKKDTKKKTAIKETLDGGDEKGGGTTAGASKKNPLSTVTNTEPSPPAADPKPKPPPAPMNTGAPTLGSYVLSISFSSSFWAYAMIYIDSFLGPFAFVAFFSYRNEKEPTTPQPTFAPTSKPTPNLIIREGDEGTSIPSTETIGELTELGKFAALGHLKKEFLNRCSCAIVKSYLLHAFH